MNKPYPRTSLEHSHRLDLRSPDLDALLNQYRRRRERPRTRAHPSVPGDRSHPQGPARRAPAARQTPAAPAVRSGSCSRSSSASARPTPTSRISCAIISAWSSGWCGSPRTDQHREWQKAVADGAIIGLAATELETPKVGDVTPNTTLTPDGDDYLLNGTKYYSTGTLYSDYVLVRTADLSGANAAALISGQSRRHRTDRRLGWPGTAADGDRHHAFPQCPGQAAGGRIRRA